MLVINLIIYLRSGQGAEPKAGSVPKRALESRAVLLSTHNAYRQLGSMYTAQYCMNPVQYHLARALGRIEQSEPPIKLISTAASC